MQCTSTFANFDDKIILVVATICGDEECPKNLGEHFKKGIWNSKTHPEDFNVLQKFMCKICSQLQALNGPVGSIQCLSG